MTGLLSAGGPIVAVDVVVAELVGVMSIGSLGGGIGELPDEEEGRIGMDFCLLEAKGSVKGERDISAVAAMGELVCRSGLGRARGDLNECGCRRGDTNRSSLAALALSLFVLEMWCWSTTSGYGVCRWW